jgi:hypothetical protein
VAIDFWLLTDKRWKTSHITWRYQCWNEPVLELSRKLSPGWAQSYKEINRTSDLKYTLLLYNTTIHCMMNLSSLYALLSNIQSQRERTWRNKRPPLLYPAYAWRGRVASRTPPRAVSRDFEVVLRKSTWVNKVFTFYMLADLLRRFLRLFQKCNISMTVSYFRKSNICFG